MQSALVITQLSFLAWSLADTLDTNAVDKVSIDKLVDKLLDKALTAPVFHGTDLDDATLGKPSSVDTAPFHHPDMDDTTLGRPGQVRISAQASARSPLSFGALAAGQRWQQPQHYTPVAYQSKSQRYTPVTYQSTNDEVGTATLSTEAVSPAPIAPTPEPATEIKEVRLTLESNEVVGKVLFRQGRSVDKKPVVYVEKVLENSLAFESGVRPNMVVKALTGTFGDERTDMWELDKSVNMRFFNDAIRLARWPIDFVLLDGVKIGSENQADADAVPLTASEARREAYDDMRAEIMEIDANRNDFPLVGALGALVLAPPILILGLNSIFHWDRAVN